MQIIIYEIDEQCYTADNLPADRSRAILHVLHLPADAQVTTLRGQTVIVLPPTSPHSPRITLTLKIAVFAASKGTIIDLYYDNTIDPATSA